MYNKNAAASTPKDYNTDIARLKRALCDADRVVIGAGAGLSTSAGFVYSGERFERYFFDFAAKYGFGDMYSGGFYPYGSPEEFWAYWSRYIWINRYADAPKPVYERLLSLVKDKDYFVITTNVDHCFQKAGFDKERLFYTQGDYGLFQCSLPCHDKTYDNFDAVRRMVLSQGWEIWEDGGLRLPGGAKPRMTVDPALVPKCPVCGRPMTVNLRSDDSFVEDEGWRRAAKRYSDFLNTVAPGSKTLFLELGVGYNTPVIIKYPFCNMTARDPDATYACVNFGEADCPRNIADRSVCIDGDIAKVVDALLGNE